MSEKQTRHYTERFRSLTSAKNRKAQRKRDLELAAQQAEENHKRNKLIPKFNGALARAMARFDSRDWDGASEILKPGGRRRDRTIPAMHLWDGIYLAADGKIYEVDEPRHEYPNELLDPKTCDLDLLEDLPHMLDDTP